MESLVVIGVVAVFGAIALGHLAFHEDARVRRALRKAPKLAIGAFPEGSPGRIVGAVAPGETIEAPLSGRRCVYFEVIVEEKAGGKNKHWRRRVREATGIPFVVSDGTGRAIIDPAHARIALEDDAHSRSGVFDAATAREEAFLARHGVESRGWLLAKTLRYQEAVIEVDEQVAVAGLAVREPDPDAGAGEGYRGAPPTRIRMNGTPAFPLLVSDQPATFG
jgi:hypothetical protein